ncbi:MAG: lysophospholipid acyltransferase family protein [Steroidobacteraceae bacterium]
MIAAGVGGALRLLCRLLTGAAPVWHCDPAAVGARIFFANHGSHLDTLVIWSTLPPQLRARTRAVAARDYWERGALRRYLATRVFRALLIDRKPPANPQFQNQQREAGMRAMTDVLDANENIIIFPEGTRGDGADLLPFRSGLFHLAKNRPDVPLVPVWLGNLARILPKGEALPVPVQGRVIFGEELRLAADEDKDGFLARCREALQALEPRRS